MPMITDPDLMAIGVEITLDTTAKTFTLIEAGDLTAKDGVAGAALWSFFVDTWTNATYQPFPFPMNIVDARSGQYIFGQDPKGSYNGWKPADDTTRQMIRNAGWSEYSNAGALNRVYLGAVGLLSGAPTGAQIYYQRASTDAASDFTFDDAPNEAIQVYGDISNGNFDKRAFFKMFCREPGYTYDDKDLTFIAETGTGGWKIQLPLAVAEDLKITDLDEVITKSIAITSATWAGGVATINTTAVHGLVDGDYVRITGVDPAGYNVRGVVNMTDTDTFEIAVTSDPGAFVTGGTVKSIYNEIRIRYFSGAFSRPIESAALRSFGIVIEAGVHCGIDGVTSGTTLTSAAGGIDIENNLYVGGTLTIHEGVDAGDYVITGCSATVVTCGAATWGAGTSNNSFTVTPPAGSLLPATRQQIYTKVEYLLRLDADIDSTGATVNGKTASLLLGFSGDTLECGKLAPTNPNGGGVGVLIEGLINDDVNLVQFYDNTTTMYEYLYVAAGNLGFNSFLTQGGAGYYKMYFTTLPGAGNDYGESGAIVVDDANDADISGTISGASIPFTFNYDDNNQGGRTPGTDAAVTVIAGNPGYAKPIEATGTLSRSKGLSITLTAEQDRGYVA